MIIRLVMSLAAIAFLSSCVVRTAGSVAKTGVGVAAGATKTTVKATGGAARAVAGHGEDDHEGELRPFDERRNAQRDVDRALAAARENDSLALIVLGGNWCHDSRGLAAKFERPELKAIIDADYELVWVDVGYRDRNLDVAHRFGIDELFGTPTVLIVDNMGVLINRDSVHDWRTAHSKPYEDTVEYFHRFASERR